MYVSDGLLKRLEANMPIFSKGQKRLAKYLLDNYDKAAFFTAAKLGEIVGVSESTVVRFAIELGYDGYPGLQQAFSELIRTNLTPVQRMVVASDRIALSKENIFKTVLNGDAERIKETVNKIDEATFNEAINKIIFAKKIYIVGGRSSFSLANFLGFYLNQMLDNIKVIKAESVGDMFEEIFRISSQDVLIGISFPRYSQITVKAMEYAASQSVTSIALTDSKQSPLVPYAAYCLYAKSDMVSFVDSLVAPMSVINAMLVAISMLKKDDLAHTLDKLEDIWEEYQVYENFKTVRADWRH